MHKESQDSERADGPLVEELEIPDKASDLPLWAHVAIGGVCGGLAAVPLAYGNIWYSDWQLNVLDPAIRELLSVPPYYSSRIIWNAIAAQDRWIVEHPQEVVRNFVIGGTVLGAAANFIYSRITKSK